MVSLKQFVLIIAGSFIAIHAVGKLVHRDRDITEQHVFPRSISESQASFQDPSPTKRRAPDMTIFALTYNRAASLERLLKSLATASYDGDVVNLNIMIDFNNDSLPQFPEVVRIAKSFYWPHGNKWVRMQTRKTHCSGQWIDSWEPKVDDTSLAGYFEDDIEVSSLWYRWVKRAHAAYKDHDDVFGYCLNRVSWNATSNGRDLLEGGPKDKESVNFMYKYFGTWGTVLKGKQMHEFRQWYHEKGGKYTEPQIPGLKLFNVWIQAFKRKGNLYTAGWEVWVDKYVNQANLTFVYAKVQGRNTALARNHKDPGMNYPKKRRADATLIQKEYDGLYDFPLPPIKLGWNGLPLS
eukprot:m.187249 g.187249  ORF g.187249 m.187249 type:complete len:350 (-) comp18502_c1_seq2:197-1246(-)